MDPSVNLYVNLNSKDQLSPMITFGCRISANLLYSKRPEARHIVFLDDETRETIVLFSSYRNLAATD
ncbi:hypothetical protein Hanom_Chr06g00518761 [Helianthus anomalus]